MFLFYLIFKLILMSNGAHQNIAIDIDPSI